MIHLKISVYWNTSFNDRLKQNIVWFLLDSFYDFFYKIVLNFLLLSDFIRLFLFNLIQCYSLFVKLRLSLIKGF